MISKDDNSLIITISKTSKLISMKEKFWDYDNTTSFDFNNFDTSNIINMDGAFGCCRSLKSLDLSSFDTSKVISMNLMLAQCSSLISINLSNFDTSNSIAMIMMFYQCSSLPILDLSSFDFSNVKDITNMFTGCTSLVDLKFGKNLKVSINLSDCPLSHESALSVIDGLAEVKEQEIIRFSEETYAALSAKEKQIIKNKNWLYIPFIN